MTEFCPQCGRARLGAFRYCQGCRLDFDALGTDGGASAATVPAAEAVVAGPSVTGHPTRRVTRRRVLVGGVAVLFGLAAIGSITPADPEAATAAVATPTPTVRVTATPMADAEIIPFPDATFGPTSQTTEATVVRVIDGDTIVVAFDGAEHKVRYIGMDAPETKDPNSLIEWMGPEATAANAELDAGKTVFLEKVSPRWIHSIACCATSG